jgi:hypothetical protein
MRGLVIVALLSSCGWTQAGLHYSGELLRPFPAKWSGYLPDHRLLRTVGTPKLNPTQPIPLLRGIYTQALLTLKATQRKRPLTADELADLGALHLRLGEPAPALDLLRTAARQHPSHFRLQSNLATAWQLNGDLAQAATALADAVELAPREVKPIEQLQLKLVRLRLKEANSRNFNAPEELFNLKETPLELAIERLQHLAMWLPSDGRLLWLLGELAYASGDVRTAANCLDGCVTEFNMGAAKLRENRQAYRNKADELDKVEAPSESTVKYRSSRALLRSVDPKSLPPIQKDGTNDLPWPVINEIEIGVKGKPSYMKYLEELDGQMVSIAGFMTGISAGGDEVSEFLFTENPVGCWFCESPAPNQLVRIELPPGKSVEQTRGLLKVTGRLQLNRTDPERLPLQITNAKVAQPD